MSQKEKKVNFRLKFFLLCIGINILFIISVFADESDSVLQFIKISPAPEVNALGNANLSNPVNAGSLYYNPALTSFLGLKPKPYIYVSDTDRAYQFPFLKVVNISAFYAKYFQSLNYGALFSTFSMKKIGTIGIGMISLFYDDITRTEINEYGNYSVSDNKLSIGDYCFLINYGYKINKRFGLGINLKGIMERLDDSTGSAIGADIGALYYMHKWGIGVVIQNIGSPVKFDNEEYNLPLDVQIGGHYIIKWRKLIIYPGDKILITGKVKKGLETEFIYGLGIEYNLREMIFTRIGYQLYGNDRGIKAGIGGNYKNFQVNYGIDFHSDLEIVHRIGLSVNIETSRQLSISASDTKEDLFKKSNRGLEVSLQSDILFEFNKAELQYNAYRILDRAVKEIRSHPNHIVMIEGNTDNIGNKEYNVSLSKKWSYAVYKYLIKKGVEKERLISVGLGPSNPIVDNATEQGRQINRRVDIVLIKMKENKTIGGMIRELPKTEREKIEHFYYFGLDKYYREDLNEAVKMWLNIKTDNKKLQNLIDQKIEEVKKEIKLKDNIQ